VPVERAVGCVVFDSRLINFLWECVYRWFVCVEKLKYLAVCCIVPLLQVRRNGEFEGGSFLCGKGADEKPC